MTGYKLLFGWWLDKRVAKRHQEAFDNEISRYLPFLFYDCGGKIVSNEGLPETLGFDYAVVTIAASNMLLRFTKGRGEFWVDVAPAHASSAWQEFGSLLASLDDKIEVPRHYTLSSVGPPLRTNFAKLEAAVLADSQGDAKEEPSRVRFIKL
jgi:hypothetical protein